MNSLLLALKEDLDSCKEVTIIDNLGIYTNPRVIKAIKVVRYRVHYLPLCISNLELWYVFININLIK